MVLLKERKIKITHHKKLNKFRNKQRPPIESIKSIVSPITNLSERILRDNEISILENGLNFVLPDNKVDEMTFISNIESFFVELLGHCTDKKDYEEKDIDEEIKYNITPIQLQCANKIRSVCNKFRYNADKIMNKHKHETNQLKNVLKNLSKDKSILITKPDKGKGIVIIDKGQYNNKMLEILNDQDTFEVIEFSETIKQEESLIRKLKQLRKDGFITEREYKYCRPRGSQPARIYGLPKIHKAGAPLRPIVSATGTFNYKLAKLLANKLDYLRKNKTIIKDTFTFVDELLSSKFDNSQIKLISFDITSLFTNVPLNRTIQIILDKVYGPEHTCTYSDLKRYDWCNKCKNRFEMKYLLDTSTKKTNFIFDNKIYSQINGVAMGSPLGPLFADIYVNYLEDKLMPRLKRNGLLYWKRFVDDTFAIVSKDVKVEKIIDILNSFDNNIVFTFEEEINNSLLFLDIYINRIRNNTLTNKTTNKPKVNQLNKKLNNNRRNNNKRKSHVVNSNNNLLDKSIGTSNTPDVNQLNKELNDNLKNNNKLKSYIVNSNNNLLDNSNNTFNTPNTNRANKEINNNLRNNNKSKSQAEKSNNNLPFNPKNTLNSINNSSDILINNSLDNSNISLLNISSNSHHTSVVNQLNMNPRINPRNNNKRKSLVENSNNNLPNNSNNNNFIFAHRNPKINSFINSVMNSKRKLLNNFNIRSNINSSCNNNNTSNNNTTIISTNNSNIKSNDKLNKKSFVNLIKDSDKKLIRTSSNILNSNPSNSMNTTTNETLSSPTLNTNYSSSITPPNKTVKFSFINPMNTIQITNTNINVLNQSTADTITNSSHISNIAANNTLAKNPLNKLVDNINLDSTITCNTTILNDINDEKTTLNSIDRPICNLNNNINNYPFVESTDNTIFNSDVTPAYAFNTLNLTNSFSTTIYRKPTYTGLITKWKSFVPKSYKVSTISSMIYRAIRICSSYRSMHQEFQFIEFIGELNGYPRNFIRSQIRKTLNRHIEKNNGTQINSSKDKIIPDNKHSPNERHIFVDIPFVGKPTDVFKKQITKITKTVDPLIKLHPIQRPPSSLSNYFPVKDPIPKLLKSKVIYKLNCNNCEATYIGKTIRHVSKRLLEHGAEFNKTNEIESTHINSADNHINLRRSDRNKNKIINYFPKLLNIETNFEQIKPINSAVKQHESSNNHKIDWTNFDIIAKDNKSYQLLVKESLLINCLKPTLNRTTCSVPLIIFPEGLITNKPKVKIKSTSDIPPLDVSLVL